MDLYQLESFVITVAQEHSFSRTDAEGRDLPEAVEGFGPEAWDPCLRSILSPQFMVTSGELAIVFLPRIPLGVDTIATLSRLGERSGEARYDKPRDSAEGVPLRDLGLLQK